MPYPEEIRWARFRVVVMIIAAIAVLSLLVYVRMGGMDVFQPTVVIRTYLQDSAGVKKGTPVRLNGILIGKVGSVKLADSRDPRKVVEIMMLLKKHLIVLVPADSTVALQADNLLGDKYINITKGRSVNPAAPGAELVAPPVLDVNQADMIKSVHDMLNNVDAALGDVESGNGSLGKLFKGDDYDVIVVRIRRVQRQIAGITNRKTTAGQFLFDDVHYRRIQTSLKRLDDTLADLQAGRGQGKLLKDSAAYDQLLRTIASADRSLAELQAGRGQGGKLLTDDRLYTDLVRQVNQLSAQVDAVNAGEGKLGELMGGTAMYESLNGSMRQLQTGIADFRANPKKYLWVKVF